MIFEEKKIRKEDLTLPEELIKYLGIEEGGYGYSVEDIFGKIIIFIKDKLDFTKDKDGKSKGGLILDYTVQEILKTNRVGGLIKLKPDRAIEEFVNIGYAFIKSPDWLGKDEEDEEVKGS